MLFPNTNRKPSLMKSASRGNSLHVLIDNNAEEVQRYEDSKDTKLPNYKGEVTWKPRDVAVSMHNPREPADMRSRSFHFPLGHTTKFLITPTAREIDESGKELTELHRNCRLDEDTDSLDIFNVYTRSACLFECKMMMSIKLCGCQPWDYPLMKNDNVKGVTCKMCNS